MPIRPSSALVRAVFAFDAATAGPLGAALVLAPRRFGPLVLDATPDPVTTRLLGAVWLAFGAASAAGVHDPARLLPVMAVQGTYKVVWLASLLARRRELANRPAVTYTAVSFLGYVAAYAVVLPHSRRSMGRHRTLTPPCSVGSF